MVLMVRAMSRWLALLGWFMVVGNVALLLAAWFLGEQLDEPDNVWDRGETDKAG